VTALDAFGNTATGFTGTAHFTSTDTQAGLPADYAFTASDAGTHVFTIVAKSAGLSAFQVSAGALAATATVAVVPGGVANFVLSGLPVSAAQGAALSFTVFAFDALGNPATNYLGTVT